MPDFRFLFVFSQLKKALAYTAQKDKGARCKERYDEVQLHPRRMIASPPWHVPLLLISRVEWLPSECARRSPRVGIHLHFAAQLVVDQRGKAIAVD